MPGLRPPPCCDVVLPELPVIPEKGKALPDGRQALGHVVAQGIHGLEGVRLALLRGSFQFVFRRRGSGSHNRVTDLSLHATMRLPWPRYDPDSNKSMDVPLPRIGYSVPYRFYSRHPRLAATEDDAKTRICTKGRGPQPYNDANLETTRPVEPAVCSILHGCINPRLDWTDCWISWEAFTLDKMRDSSATGKSKRVELHGGVHASILSLQTPPR